MSSRNEGQGRESEQPLIRGEIPQRVGSDMRREQAFHVPCKRTATAYLYRMTIQMPGGEPGGSAAGCEAGAPWGAEPTLRNYRLLAELRHLVARFLMFSEAAAREAGLAPRPHQALLAIKGH